MMNYNYCRNDKISERIFKLMKSKSIKTPQGAVRMREIKIRSERNRNGATSNFRQENNIKTALKGTGYEMRTGIARTDVSEESIAPIIRVKGIGDTFLRNVSSYRRHAA
jgi:hypothetical protein